MRYQNDRGRSTSWIGNRLPTRDLADPVLNANAIRAVLPDVIAKAEAAGLSIIATHLGKALRLAEGVAGSGQRG